MGFGALSKCFADNSDDGSKNVGKKVYYFFLSIEENDPGHRIPDTQSSYYHPPLLGCQAKIKEGLFNSHHDFQERKKRLVGSEIRGYLLVSFFVSFTGADMKEAFVVPLHTTHTRLVWIIWI